MRTSECRQGRHASELGARRARGASRNRANRSLLWGLGRADGVAVRRSADVRSRREAGQSWHSRSYALRDCGSISRKDSRAASEVRRACHDDGGKGMKRILIGRSRSAVGRALSFTHRRARERRTDPVGSEVDFHGESSRAVGSGADYAARDSYVRESE